jgi:hypothetical protein
MSTTSKNGRSYLNSGRGEVSRLSVASFAGAFMAMVSFVFLLSVFPFFSLFQFCGYALFVLTLKSAVFVLLGLKT